MSAEPFLADPSFPQLGVVKDPELMREVVQRHLLPLDSYKHHREARRCVLHYDLHLAEPGTGRKRSQLVTGVMYSGNRTRRTWEKLQRSQSRGVTAGASPTFAPFSYIPDLDMLMQIVTGRDFDDSALLGEFARNPKGGVMSCDGSS